MIYLGLIIDFFNFEFIANGNFSIGKFEFVLKFATCAYACTPASVLLVPLIFTSQPHTVLNAFSTAPCTVGLSGCLCHPEKPVPSYSMVSIFI